MASPKLQVMTPTTTETRELRAMKAAPDARASRRRGPLTLRPQPNPVPNATAPVTDQTRIVEEAILRYRVTYGLIDSNVAGPIPDTSSS